MLSAEGLEKPLWYRKALSSREIDALISASSGIDKSCRLALQSGLVDTFRETEFYNAFLNERPGAKLTKASLFVKSEAQSWALAWHQDRVIAVKDKYDFEGFTNWTRKDGVWHCQAPEGLLKRMMFLRVHLDENTSENGAMEIAKGNYGFVPSIDIENAVSESSREVCIASAGDILALPMLTLHRSLPSKQMSARRVLRVDIAYDDLPKPLEWN